MWFIAPLEMPARARVFHVRSLLLCLIVCSTLRCEQLCYIKIQHIHIHTSACVLCVRVCVWMQEAMGWASLSVTALLFCSVIGVDKEPVTLLLWLVKSGDSASLLTMTLHG